MPHQPLSFRLGLIKGLDLIGLNTGLALFWVWIYSDETNISILTTGSQIKLGSRHLLPAQLLIMKLHDLLNLHCVFILDAWLMLCGRITEWLRLRHRYIVTNLMDNIPAFNRKCVVVVVHCSTTQYKDKKSWNSRLSHSVTNIHLL